MIVLGMGDEPRAACRTEWNPRTFPVLHVGDVLRDFSATSALFLPARQHTDSEPARPMLRSLCLLCCLVVGARAFAFGPASALRVQRTSLPAPLPVCMPAKSKAPRTNERRRAYNKMYNSEMKTRLKKARRARPSRCEPRRSFPIPRHALACTCTSVQACTD